MVAEVLESDTLTVYLARGPLPLAVLVWAGAVCWTGATEEVCAGAELEALPAGALPEAMLPLASSPSPEASGSVPFWLPHWFLP